MMIASWMEEHAIPMRMKAENRTSTQESSIMRLRCVGLIAVWTILSGPAFGPPVMSRSTEHKPMTVASTPKARKTVEHQLGPFAKLPRQASKGVDR